VLDGRPHPAYPPLALAAAVWGLGAALYLIGFFHRVAPAVLTDELAAEFELGAAALGNLSAVYFYSYVAMQIPTGLAADHWGPRRIIALGAAVAALGAALFALAHAYALVALGRFLVGAAVGVAFVSMLKLSTHWFDPSRFAAIAGIALAVGVAGAVSAGAPLRIAADAFGWRQVMVGAAVAAALLAVVAWIIVRDDPRDRGYRSYMPRAHGDAPRHSVLGGLRTCLRERNSVLVFFANAAISGAPLTFAGLWGVPFLATHYEMSTAVAASLCSLVLVGWAAAGPFFGVLSDRLGVRKPPYLAGAVVALGAWLAVIQTPQLSFGALVALLALAGAASGCVMLGFALAKETAPPTLAGTVGGIVNMGNMLGGMLLQPAIGLVLDRHWEGAVAFGVRVYTVEAYRAGFALMLAWLAVAVVLVLFTRETRCRQRG
jgi:MFS family permease